MPRLYRNVDNLSTFIETQSTLGSTHVIKRNVYTVAMVIKKLN